VPPAGLSTPLAAALDPVFASQATFRTVLLAMARPGSIGRVAAADPGCPLPVCRVLAAVARTLLDHEVAFAVVTGKASGDDGAAELAAYLAETTGARQEPVAAADYVLLLGQPPGGLPAALRRGRPAHPDEGATLIAVVPSLGPSAEGAAVALAGPGVAPGARLDLAGRSAGDVAALAEVNGEPPLGIDLILATPDGEVACLPRSTRTRIQLAGDERA